MSLTADYKRPLRPGEHERQYSQIIRGAPTSEMVWEGDRLTRSQDFDYDEIDRNCFDVEDSDTKSVGWSDMVASFAIILDWIVGSSKPTVAGVASRAIGLQLLLSPTQCYFESLEEIGKACGITRAAISANLVKLRDSAGLPFSLGGKPSRSREAYSRAQKAAVAAGTHSSCRKE